MRRMTLALGVTLAVNAYADSTVVMNNGMVCFVNNVGYMYGCHGGTSTGDTGFNDVQTGQRYESIGGNQGINTRTGQTFYYPNQEVYDYEEYDDEAYDNDNNFEEYDYEVYD